MDPNETDPTNLQIDTKPFYKKKSSNTNTERLETNFQPNWDEQQLNRQRNDERRIAIPNVLSGDLQELDKKVKSMMEMSQNISSSGSKGRICTLCGKEGQYVAIRDHIEANHLEGVLLPCNVCGKELRSRSQLRKHNCIC